MGSLLRLCVGLLTGVTSWMSSFLCRIVGSVPSFFFRGGEPREDSARREKSETKLSRFENSRKRRIVVSSSKETSKKDLSFSRGEKREFLRHFFPQRRERFSTFFSSESVNKREGRKGKEK